MSAINMTDGLCCAADLTTCTRGDRSTGSLQIYNPQQDISPQHTHTHTQISSQERNETQSAEPTHTSVVSITCDIHNDTMFCCSKVTTWTGNYSFNVVAHKCIKIWTAATWELWSNVDIQISHGQCWYWSDYAWFSTQKHKKLGLHLD